MKIPLSNSEKWISYSHITAPILGGLIGTLFFLYFFGYEIINPTNFKWVSMGDAGQHFLGWHFFRHEPWSFPLGRINNLMYPEGTSIVFTDSIPLLAIPLKLFKSFLLDYFQIQGIWIFSCYVLQGAVAAFIIQRYTKNYLIIAATSFLFIQSPLILQRISGHEALAAHWIILLGIDLLIRPPQKLNLTKWTILLSIACLTHFYLFGMVLVLCIASIGRYILCVDHKSKTLFHLSLKLAGILGLIAIQMWLAGYFILETGKSQAGGIGHYSWNPISFITPLPSWKASFLTNIPLATSGQYEGYSYLGAGIIFLAFLSIYAIFTLPKKSFFQKKHIPIVLSAIALMIIALSNKVTFAEHTLFTIPLPPFIKDMWSIFRSSGRFIWPVYYLIYLSVFIAIIRKFKPKTTILLLLTGLILQTGDTYHAFTSKGTHLNTRGGANILQDPRWDLLMDAYSAIDVVPAIRIRDNYIPLGLKAAPHKNKINIAYVARQNDEKRKIYQDELIKDFEHGDLRSDTIYVIEERSVKIPEAENIKTGIIENKRLILPDYDKKQLKIEPDPWDIYNQEAFTIEDLIACKRNNHIIIISIKDEATASLSAETRERLSRFSLNFKDIKYRNSYLAIIDEGKVVTQKKGPDSAVEASVNLSGYHIKSYSAGFKHGNKSEILINGKDYSPNMRGLNIVIIDKKENKIYSAVYDTHKSNKPKSTLYQDNKW